MSSATSIPPGSDIVEAAPVRRALYRPVAVTTWGELRNLHNDARLLGLVLRVNDRTDRIPGLYIASRLEMAEMMGWERELARFDRAIKALEDAGQVRAAWGNRLIWVPPAVREGPLPSILNVKGWLRQMANLPRCALLLEAVRSIAAALDSEAGKDGSISLPLRMAYPEAFGSPPQAMAEPYRTSSSSSSSSSSSGDGDGFRRGMQEREREGEERGNGSREPGPCPHGLKQVLVGKEILSACRACRDEGLVPR